MLRFIAIALIFVSTAVAATPTDNGWSMYATFNKDIVLWEKPDGENFMRYGITNHAETTICVIPYTYGNSHTRVGLQVAALMPSMTGALHELGFITYKNGDESGSAVWVLTLILIENQCSLPLPSQPSALPEPLS